MIKVIITRSNCKTTTMEFNSVVAAQKYLMTQDDILFSQVLE